MQLKHLLICSIIIGSAFAQRGHYAGNRRPILGSRYQSEVQGGTYDRFNGDSNALNTPQQQNGVAQSPQKGPNTGGFNSLPQQQGGSVGGFMNQGFPNQGFQNQGFQNQGFHNHGFYPQGFPSGFFGR